MSAEASAPATEPDRGARARPRRHSTPGRWAEAYAALSAADRDSRRSTRPTSSGWRVAARLHRPRRARASTSGAARTRRGSAAGDTERAARAAVWLAIRHPARRRAARGAAAGSRAARRLLDEGGRDCVERGYLLLPQASGRRSSAATRPRAAASSPRRRASASGSATATSSLLGRMGEGRSLIRLGEIARGMALLDEVMVAVTADEVSPVVVGDIYCSVIDACHETFDLRRAQEWTGALVRWAASQPDASPYRGSCLIHRAELLQLHGEWPDALGEAGARLRVSGRAAGAPAIGAAWYRLAELHRLRGEAEEAEELYRQRQPVGPRPASRPGAAPPGAGPGGRRGRRRFAAWWRRRESRAARART